MFELLQDKTYIRYWIAVVVSFLGDAITLTSIIYLVGVQSGSAMLISLALLAQLLPSVLLGPLIGPLIDRWNRRTVLVAADLYRVVIVLLMIPFQQSPAALISLLFLQGIGTGFFEPARIASVPALVGAGRIPQGIALFQSTSAAIKFAGPVFAGILLSYVSVSAVFIYDSVSFFVSALLLASLNVLNTPKQHRPKVRMLTDMAEGMRTLFQHKMIRPLLFMLMPVMAVIGILVTNFKELMIHAFRLSSLQYGWVEALFALGLVSGALYGPRLLSRYTPAGLMRLSLVVVAIASLAAWLLPDLKSAIGLLPVLAWSLLLGFGESLLHVPTANLLLQQMPEEIRGRGIALSNSILNGCFAAGYLAGGAASQAFGNINSFILAGVILLLLFALFRSAGVILYSSSAAKG
jgi:MFS transporter, DHA3 family, macrolide efflux protein